MFDFNLNNRGVALLVVLATIFVAVLLANITLNMMVSQSRLTHHKVSRIQAYYAGLAAINYAQEELRTGNWTDLTCPAPSGCELPFDANFPQSISQPIRIILTAPGGGAGGCAAPPGSFCISIQVQYTNP